MKKLMATLMASAMVLSMAACGTKTAGTATSDTASTATADTATSTAKSDPNTLSLNLASEPDHLDPALNSSVDGACLAVNSFVGLLTYDKDGKLQPAIASSYDVSEDKLTYTFHLIDSKWSDGTPLTAKDFVYSWNRAANPQTASDYGYLFDGLIAKNEVAEEKIDNPSYDEAKAKADPDNYKETKQVYSEAALAAQAANEILKGVEAVDDTTLKVTLLSPCPYFLSLCAFPTFYPVPQASVEAANKDGTNPGAWASEAGFVSNGAYTCTAWTHDESMTYEKNPNYYDAANVKIEKLQFMLSSDDAAIFAAYNAGNLDFIDTVPNAEVASLKGINPEFQVIPNLGTYYWAFNVNSKLFDGKTPEQATAMREAMSLLVDRQYIVDNIGQTDQEIANTFIPTGMSDGNGGVFRENTSAYTYPDKDSTGYYPVSEESYDANVAKAVELLKSAGYKFGDNNMLDASTPISFTYLTNSGTGNEAIAAALQQDMAAVGIVVNIQAEDWKVFLNDRKAGNYDVAREGWLADFDDPINMLEMWITDSGNNDAQFGRGTNGQRDGSGVPSYAPQDWSKYNDLIASIKSETDFTKRVALMHQAEDMLMGTYALVPVYYYNDMYMMKSNCTGMYSNAFGYKYFMYMTKS